MLEHPISLGTKQADIQHHENVASYGIQWRVNREDDPMWLLKRGGEVKYFI